MPKFRATSIHDFTARAAVSGRKARGAKIVVHVEADDGSWCELDADSQDHAKVLARNWVDNLAARGCSCRTVNVTGVLRATPFFTYYATGPEPEDDYIK